MTNEIKPKKKRITNFPKYLYNIRHKRGLSQEKFAKLLDCSTGYITYLEIGFRSPGNAFLKKLGEFLGIVLKKEPVITEYYYVE